MRLHTLHLRRRANGRAHSLFTPVRSHHLGFPGLVLDPLFEGEGDGGGGGGGVGGGNGDGAGGKTFTQEDVNRIVANRIADERRRGNIKPEEREELAALRSTVQQAELATAEKEKNWGLAKESLIKSHNAAMDSLNGTVVSLRSRLYDVTVRQRIEAAASALATDPTDISALLKDRVKFNDKDEPVVYDEHGNPAFVNGIPMTPEQMVTAYLAQPAKAHLRKATQRKPSDAGDGASGADDKPGGGDGNKTAEVVKLEKELAEAEKAAGSSHQAADITRVLSLERQLAEARKKKA